jgi:hypothetical protein
VNAAPPNKKPSSAYEVEGTPNAVRRQRLKVLYLDANGFGSRMIFVDTVLRGIFGYKDGDAPPALLQRFRRVNVLFSVLRQVYDYLSYVADWRDAFLKSPRLDVDVCSINNLVQLGRCLLRIRNYDLIVVSHAAAGDDMSILARTAFQLQKRRCKLVMFVGNEYDLLDEKITFMRRVRAEFICSQLPLDAASYLYRDCDDSRVLEMPHALNPDRYFVTPGIERTTDIGFIGDIYWPFIGDRERTDLIEWFERNGAVHNLRCDIRRSRIPRDAWRAFLNQCKGVIGAESGTYYLNDRGRLLERARAYNLFQNRDASFDEVFDKFYRGQERGVSGKSVSSRHFEPIGTKTCQILLEGHYNGILKPDVHYVCVRKDLSNIKDAVERFSDESIRSRMVQDTYDYAMSQHTYAHRVEQLLHAVS